MLARTGENRFPGCPIRTSGPIRPRAFAQMAQSSIYYGGGPVGGLRERPGGNRSLTVAALMESEVTSGRKSREEMYAELR